MKTKKGSATIKKITKDICESLLDQENHFKN